VSSRTAAAGRFVVVALGAAVAAVVGWALFVWYPVSLTELFGVLLTIGTVLVGGRIAGRIARRRFPTYNVAEVAVEGPITRDGGGAFPTGPVGTPADDVVDQIERADGDPAVSALLLKLNTPGGEVVPSDDIRNAAVEFDGPTVAFATDTCASGGYWIASGCDEFWARDASIVGSIGVIGSRPNVSELADRLGVSYERFAAGKYKDAGLPLKELSEDDRTYLQGIVDDYYERFVERVAEGRGLDPEDVRGTEARVYLGSEAADIGLVDDVGTRDDVEGRLRDLVDAEPAVREFEPQRPFRVRFVRGTAGVAYAFGAGVAARVAPEDGFDFRL
jgi:protease-4